MDPTRCFEGLEARALLSAPVASVQSFAATATTMTVVVQYTASAGIDPASIDYNDLGVTAPDGTERVQAGTIESTSYQNSTGIWFQNPGGRPFDYTDPSGTYTAALGVYDGTQLVGYQPAAQAWWWFSGPKVEVLSTSVTN